MIHMHGLWEECWRLHWISSSLKGEQDSIWNMGVSVRSKNCSTVPFYGTMISICYPPFVVVFVYMETWRSTLHVTAKMLKCHFIYTRVDAGRVEHISDSVLVSLIHEHVSFDHTRGFPSCYKYGSNCRFMIKRTVVSEINIITQSPCFFHVHTWKYCP